jgi:hypothetical protein
VFTPDVEYAALSTALAGFEGIFDYRTGVVPCCFTRVPAAPRRRTA